MDSDLNSKMQILYVRSYESIVSFAISEGDCPPARKKIFRLAALAIIIPPTCESESAPLLTVDWHAR
jgi:hypothetical protein